MNITREVTCNVHPGRPCRACVLCKQGNLSKYFHPKTWKSTASMDILRELEPALGIQLDSCICRRCRNDVRRLSEPGFIPRWRKESLPHKHCCVPECVNPAQKLTKLVNNEQLWRQFSMPDTHNPVGNDVSGYPLCTTHYGELYRKLHPVIKNCKTCNKVIDHAKHRKCPDPTLIERFLQHNTSFSGTIDANDPICYACYKAHLVIVKLTSSTTDSSDHDLHTLIQQLKGELKNEGEISTQEEAVSHAVRMSAVLVGETLLVQNAILLPEVFDYFESIYSMTAQDVVQQCSLHSIANPTWLLSQLSALLEQHMSYRCSVKKYGTVLYRYGGDLLHALNVSLGQSRTKSSVELKSDPSEQHDQFQKHLHEVCVTLNAKCHVATKKLVNENLGFQHLIEKVDIGKCIDDLDPDLWKAICLITQPLSSKALTSVNGSHIRQMRRFFCACCLLYATNNQCSFPLHTLITDVVLTCGGSSRLVKFLNRLGICTSADKHDRYVTERVKKRKEDGVLSAYPDGAFTVASTDNLDFLHHYARVYCGKQQTSWHGTTVQLVQPQPSNIIDSQSHSNADCSAPDTPEREVTTLVEGMRGCDTHVSHNRHPASGLQASISKRLFSIISPAKSPTRNAPPRKQQCTEQTQEKSLGIADFQLSEIETKAIDKLERMATDYAMLKVASCEHNISLIDLQTYYSLSNGIPSPECSNVIYFMVLDQRCDDKETLLNVISELHTEFIASKKKMYLLLEGDQVTYEHLQSIKKEYGNDLKWLLPFPGDWHLLKNYQEVLLKIYFDAGLSDLAKISGYLPNSVGAKFKRIHHIHI